MILLFIALAAVQLTWLKAFIPYEVKQDKKAIDKDGSKNSLGRLWHSLSAAKVVLLSAVLSAGFIHWHWSIAAANVLVLWALFWKYFDQQLNIARGKPANYVGSTADIDKWYWKHYHMKAPSVMQRHKLVLLGVAYLLLGISVCYYYIWIE